LTRDPTRPGQIVDPVTRDPKTITQLPGYTYPPVRYCQVTQSAHPKCGRAPPAPPP